MNQTIDLILSHRSIRQFTAEPIAPQQLDAILAAAQSASTSSFLQVTSIVRVTAPEARQQLAMLAGQVSMRRVLLDLKPRFAASPSKCSN